MLLSPNSPVVFFCRLEELEMAITRRRYASLTERLQLEAAIGCIKTVERHLDSVEWVIVSQHFEMYRRTLMSGETNKTYLALPFRFLQRFDHTTLCEMQVRVVLVDDLVNLP